jgi:hypothetical protein
VKMVNPKFQDCIGNHAAHPGSGLGPRPRLRPATTRPMEASV